MLSACSRSNEALHDTYYVVSNTSSLLFFTTLAVVMVAAWNAILRRSKRPLRKAAIATLATFALGGLLHLAPYLSSRIYDPTSSDLTPQIVANRLALIGSAVVILTALFSLGILIAIGLTAFLRKR